MTVELELIQVLEQSSRELWQENTIIDWYKSRHNTLLFDKSEL